MVTKHPYQPSSDSSGSRPDNIPVRKNLSFPCLNPSRYLFLALQEAFRKEKVAEIKECWNRRYASFLHLQLDEISDIHPLHQEHSLLARRVFTIGSLLCGTNLASSPRGYACLFHDSPNVVQTLPVLPYASHRHFLEGRYSWNTRELLSQRVEGLIFPFVLLASRTYRYTVPPDTRESPNIVLHFLGNGLSCGEVIQPIKVGETLIRHWSLGPFTWWNNERTEGWASRAPRTQARVLFELLKPADPYFLDCLAHDADDTRTDRSSWYNAATFGVLSTMNRIVAESVEASVLAHLNTDYAWSCARDECLERSSMSACDINVYVNVIDP